MTALFHGRERRRIDRHFALRSTVETDLAMRAHLAGCGSCRGYYERHALLAELDPQAAPAVDRLARGLGFSPLRPQRSGFWAMLRQGPVLVPSALAVLLVGLWIGHRPAPDGEFQARGGATAPLEPRLHAYRIFAGRSAALGPDMAPDDELGFGYENPTGFARLLVVSADGRGKVFWYHPDPEASAVAVPIATGAGRHELPEAIRHDHQAGELHIFGIFTNQALSVAEVEQSLDRAGCAGLRQRLPEIACAELKVMVKSRPEQTP